MKTRRRRVIGIMCIAVAAIVWIVANNSPTFEQPSPADQRLDTTRTTNRANALAALQQLPVKGRAAKTGYSRTQFGDGWQRKGLCDMRNIILNRDLQDAKVDEACKVVSGKLPDPYTGSVIMFSRGKDTSDDVQIDHVVALSNAWQTGAQQLTRDQRVALANDALELLAVSGDANQAKGDGDAATWLPPNKAFRCYYVARQIAVKAKYGLWVTPPEKDAMTRVLDTCPDQTLPDER